MQKKHFDALVILALTATNIIWALLPYHFPVIGVVIALPLVFVLPGYTLTEVLFHSRPLDAVYRVILSLGLSLAIDVLAGFILNAFPIGLREISWAVLLGLITTFFSLWIIFLRWKKVASSGIRNRFHVHWYELFLFGLALAIVILSVRYSVINVVQEPHPSFTQLWILPSNQANNNCAVSIGIHSFESTPVTFRAVMKTNGTQVTIWSPIALNPQGEWDRVVPINLYTSNSINIEVLLYRIDKPGNAYREVHLTLYSSKRSKDTLVQQCTT